MNDSNNLKKINDYDSLNIDFKDIQIPVPHYEMPNIGVPDEVDKALKEANLGRQQVQQAQIKSAKDIAEIKEHMANVIENQQVQIEQQKEQIDRQEKTIDQLQALNDKQNIQLQRLKEIFYSIEDGTAVNKEIMEELEELLNQQPGWQDFISDKGADIVIGAFLAVLPKLLKLVGIVL